MSAIIMLPENCVPVSFKPEVEVQGAWSANGLRFRTEAEAHAYAQDLYSRWTLCSGFRATPCGDEPTHEWIDGCGLRDLSEPGAAPRMPARRVQL
jgi:hypothetical protein